MTDRPFLPTDEDVIEAARVTGHTPEYVAESMNSPLGVRAERAVTDTMDAAEIEAACDAVLERTVPGFGGAIMEAMLEGYKLGFGHGVQSMAAVDSVAGLLDVIRRTFAATRPPSDVRPHVPHVDPDADDRLHLIVEGVTACGVPATAPGRQGTHEEAEADCPDCRATLQRVTEPSVAEGGLVARAAQAAAVGDLGPAEELARAMHPGAFEDEPCPYGYPLGGMRPHVDWCRHVAGHEGRHHGQEEDGRRSFDTRMSVRRGTPEAAHAERGRGPVDDGRLGPVVPPRGWDRIEGDPDAVEHLDPMAVAVGSSLGGELIDMTQAAVDYAREHDLRWWQCRHCARGRVMGPLASTTVEEGRVDLNDHEQDCEHKGAAVDA